MNAIRWHRDGDGEYLSTCGRFRMVHHRNFDARKRTGVNLLVLNERGVWECNDSYETFREAKLAAAERAAALEETMFLTFEDGKLVVAASTMARRGFTPTSTGRGSRCERSATGATSGAPCAFTRNTWRQRGESQRRAVHVVREGLRREPAGACLSASTPGSRRRLRAEDVQAHRAGGSAVKVLRTWKTEPTAKGVVLTVERDELFCSALRPTPFGSNSPSSRSRRRSSPSLKRSGRRGVRGAIAAALCTSARADGSARATAGARLSSPTVRDEPPSSHGLPGARAVGRHLSGRARHRGCGRRPHPVADAIAKLILPILLDRTWRDW